VRLRFHHVGVAVRSLDEALGLCTGLLGFRAAGPPVEVPHEGVRVCMLEAEPGVRIELGEGLAPGSPVHGVLERAGPGPYHLCYEVEDLDGAIRTLRAGGCFPFRWFDSPAPGARRFVFLLTPDRQVFELCEPDRREGAGR
jgi:methylmalonyl-CoA/ethylmalonyl-CoA epimerase